MLDRMLDGMRKRYDRMRGGEQWLREGGIAGSAEILSITATGKWIGVESHGQSPPPSAR